MNSTEESAPATRVGNFSSSKVADLMKTGKQTRGFGAPAITYIEEKVYERLLGRPINKDVGARAATWGHFVEELAFNKLKIGYKLESKTRYEHVEYPYWNGMPDLIDELDSEVADIKCPFTIKSYCQMVDCFKGVSEEEAIANLKKLKPEYYWQLVSNAILTGMNDASLILYVPYQEELSEIREEVDNYLGDQNKIAWINWASDNELPYLVESDAALYRNIESFRFKVPQEDKDALTSRVVLAKEVMDEIIEEKTKKLKG